jgi:transketolase
MEQAVPHSTKMSTKAELDHITVSLYEASTMDTLPKGFGSLGNFDVESSSTASEAVPCDFESEMRCINYLRVLAADMVQQANSGHPGAAMGCAPIAHCLWAKQMKYNPADPTWVNRDRFILSNGHACALQYSMLHLTGYDLSLEDLKAFRQLGSKTPGHPEVHQTPGIEVATGPLGQGLSNGVGLAIAGAHLAATFNREQFPILDNFVYVICGDGCMQEGITSEACSLAGHLGLGRLIVLYDDNKIQIDGSTDLAFTEDVMKRYEAYGWQTIHVSDGDTDLEGLQYALESAKRELSRPTLIKVTTTIGFGAPSRERLAFMVRRLASKTLMRSKPIMVLKKMRSSIFRQMWRMNTRSTSR